MLITSESTNSYTKRQAGGKAYNLYLLNRQGFNVPRWVVLSISVFEDFKNNTSLAECIDSKLASLKAGEVSVKQVSADISKCIIDTPLLVDIELELTDAFESIDAQYIAVRSSAAGEDSAKNSFAGQLSTELFVSSLPEALIALKKCWASAFSERNLLYRIENSLGLQPEDIKMAVIIQEMIIPDKSGVMFTCDPIQQESSKITINSVYGLGEGLVSGAIDGDTFVIDKNSGVIDKKNIASKKTMFVGDNSGAVSEVKVEHSLQGISSINDDEINILIGLAFDIDAYYNFPQDIEWAICGDQLYVLQARPVTSPLIMDTGVLNIWDNSNISESYSGLTLPLTFGFAHYVYHQVYVQFCEILLVPAGEIKNMDYFLKNMLGLFYGRVYYNLLNWYKLTSILPGFKHNSEFMETMMGTNKSLESEVADRIKPPGFQETLSSKIFRAVTGVKFVYYHFAIQRQVDRFMGHFYPIYDEYRRLDYARMPADEILQKYQELEVSLLRRWKAPIINDFLCMVHFGLLKKLTKKWLSGLGESLQNNLLCGEGNLESTEPTRELMSMAIDVNRNPKLKLLLESTPDEDCLEALNQSSFADFRARVDNYIDKYGFRCMNEMKLEQKDLYQDPTFLFVCLKNYLRYKLINPKEYSLKEQKTRKSAEEVAKNSLSFTKKIMYFWSLKNARKAVRNRENTRFCRTRIYGVVRSMFYGIGEDYARRQIIEMPDDIFYLELTELMGTLEGTLSVQNLKLLIDTRKAEYEKYKAVEPASRFTTRGPVYWMNNHFPAPEAVAEEPETNRNILKGIGCSPGVAEGTVKIVLSRTDNMQLDGQILVARQTDPGWIPLYPSAAGLLVERGGLLSHSAIVAREMGLPTIVSIPGLVDKLKNGMKIRFDGKTGIIEIL